MASTTIREHIRNPSTNWKCIGFNTNLLAEQISAVARENVENVGGDGQPPTNHWTLFLALDDGGSIQVNACPGTPVPGRSGYPGLILVSPESCAFADANVAVISGTSASENTTIEDIFSCIIANGRDRYEFAPVGEGCRYWLQNVTADLARAGIIDASFAEAAHAALCKYWPYPKGTLPIDRPVTRGSFLPKV